jgi:hypothetical protein
MLLHEAPKYIMPGAVHYNQLLGGLLGKMSTPKLNMREHPSMMELRTYYGVAVCLFRRHWLGADVNASCLCVQEKRRQAGGMMKQRSCEALHRR